MKKLLEISQIGMSDLLDFLSFVESVWEGEEVDGTLCYSDW